MLNPEDENRRKEVHDRIIEYWRTRGPFRDEDDIPTLPRVSEEEYTTIIIPNLIRCGAISKSQLIDGKSYIGSCRNASEAVWHQDKNRFTYIRHKLGWRYEENINHFEDDDGYDLFVPIKEKQTI